MQNYTRARFDADGPVPPPAELPVNQMRTAVEPESLGGAVRYAHQRSGVPVFVTEHGVAHPDDTVRTAFIPAALHGLLDAIDDGVPVIGYTHWTLMDNYEWAHGYAWDFGLVHVDFDTLARTPKPSAAVYEAIVRANAVGSAG